jgi:hypothetical protein
VYATPNEKREAMKPASRPRTRKLRGVMEVVRRQRA